MPFDPKVVAFLETLLWTAPYGECFYCSTQRVPVRAAYEAWFALSGDMLMDAHNEMLPPHTSCHTLCEECMAVVREEQRTRPNPDIVLVKARTL